MNYLLTQIAEAVGGTLIGNGNIRIKGVITDSRGVGHSSDKVFVAINGVNHDGHDYINKLQDAGIQAFIVEKPAAVHLTDRCGIIVVEDSLKALQMLAVFHRKSLKCNVIGVTGSNGKTILKEWIAQLCPLNYKLFRSPRSYNSQVGVPLSLLMAEGDEQIVVIEAGISEPGEMSVLERIIKPTIGIITNIGDAHSENFESIEAKLKEKLLLFEDCKTIIFNCDNGLVTDNIIKLYNNANLFKVSVVSSSIESDTLGKINIDLSSFPCQDYASRENVLGAIAALIASGVSPDDCCQNLSKIQPVAMRLELKDGIGGCKIVNDTYNSDINSLRLALEYMSSISAGQPRTLILSDILQSGYTELELYTEVAKMVREAQITSLIGIGEGLVRNSELFDCEKQFFLSTNAFVSTCNRNNFHNQTILIKGSRRYQFERISRILEKKVHTTVLEVNLDAMAHNLNYFRSKLRPGTKVMAMVKAFSYGFGGYEIAAMLENQRVDYLAVAYADEGIALRESGIVLPIVVLNADVFSFAHMIEYNLEPELYSMSSLNTFISEAKRYSVEKYPIHLKLDTGMHRLGFNQSEITQVIDVVKANGVVGIKSVFSHLATADDVDSDDFVYHQLNQFVKSTDMICAEFPDMKILRHISNSAAIERFPQANFDMVRLGIGLYGVSAIDDRNLQNVSTLKSHIVQLRTVSHDETVGYGRKGKLLKDSVIATVAIGYADGMDRHLSCGKWRVKVAGQLAPIVGNICMDTCMIDVTELNVHEGDEVELFGVDNNISLMATVLDTIPYEIMTSVSSRIKRIFIKE